MAETKMTGIIAKASNSVAKASKPKTMQDYVQSMSGEIKKALPSVITPERFMRMTLSALSSNPDLAETTPQSFLGAMMSAAQLGLEPNTPLGQAYLIPYRNKGTLECQFQLGYRGLLNLAWRSGEIVSINAEVVYENDEFEYELGLDPKLKHIPARSDRGLPIFYYACFKTKLGGVGFKVMSIDEIRAYAQEYSRSSGSKYSPWTTNFNSMAKKTLIKAVLKYAPIGVELSRSLVVDGTIKHSISSDMSTVPDETDYIDTEIIDNPSNSHENGAEDVPNPQEV